LVIAQMVVNRYLLAQQGSPGAGEGLLQLPAAFPALVEEQVEHRQADEPDGENDKKDRVGGQHLSDDENRDVGVFDDFGAVGAQQVQFVANTRFMGGHDDQIGTDILDGFNQFFIQLHRGIRRL
ncbi:MAG: hypothetical protein AWU57_5373, partial [Marinobacter sp. T13-3]